MTRALPARFGLAPQATRQIRRRQLVIGGVLICFGFATFAAGLGAPLSLLLIFMGVALAILGRFTAELGEAGQVLNRAANTASSGRLNDAGELLDYAEATYLHRYVRRGIDLQRATIAMHHGDLEEARRRADAAITRPLSLSLREHERLQITAAYALRALLRASLGDPDGAQADIEIVRKSPHTTPDSLARAEFAAALLLERAGDLDALRTHLTSQRTLLLEHTQLRERAIARAYERMLASTSNIYRTSAPRDPIDAEEPKLADWAAKLSPGAALFLHTSRSVAKDIRTLADGEIPAIDDESRAAAKRRFEATGGGSQWIFVLLLIILPMIGLAVWQGFTPESSGQNELSFFPIIVLVLAVFAIAIGLVLTRSWRARRVAERRRSKGNDGGSLRALVLGWVALLLIGVAILQGLAPEPSMLDASDVASSVEDTEALDLIVMLVAFSIAMGIAIGLAFALSLRVQRAARRLRLSQLEIARGNGGAIQDLAGLGKSPVPLIAAEAHLSLAELAEQRGELPGAVAECDAALGSLKDKAAWTGAAEVLLPSIYAERAFLFAAMDRTSDAHAEIALLAERYPSYRYLDKARFRVALVQKARHGAIAEAANVAEQTADLPLSARDELLARLVCAVGGAGTAGAGEVERLREEIGLGASRRWLTVVAPAVLEAFSQHDRGHWLR